MATIKDHVQVLKSDQTLLPGNETTFQFPKHAASHYSSGYDPILGELGPLTYVDFNLSPGTVAHSEGRLHWNEDDKTLNLCMSGGNVELQVGQEHLIRAKNTSGGPITNGQVVYISGGTGSFPTLALGDAGSLSTATVIGMATEDIANNNFGYVTTQGLVRDVNTASDAAGTILWLDSSPGGYTSTRPTQPDFGVVVGQVIRQHATEGVIYCKIDIVPRLVSLSDVSISGPSDNDFIYWDNANSVWKSKALTAGDANLDSLGVYGFENQTDTTIAFNDSTYQFTLGDAGGGWSYWRNGVKVTISGNKTVTLAGSPPAAGVYFIYIDDESGTLTASTSPWTLADTKVPVAIVYWNNANTPKYFLANERHQSIYPRRVHWEHHFTSGTEVKSGGALSGYVVPAGVPSGDTDNTFGIAEVELIDEDLLTTSAALPDPNGVDLDYIAYFRTGASTWSWEQSAVPFRYTAAGYIQWDNAGTMTQGINNKYYNWYLCFTNSAGQGRYILVPGQSEFSSAGAAYGEEINELDLSGFDPQELVFAYQLTFLTNSGYGTKGKCKLTRDPFLLNISGVSASVTGGTIDHNTLGSLQGGNGVDEFYHLTAANHGYIDQDVTTTASPTFTGLTLASGGTIASTSNGDISLVPNGTGITKIGTGSTSHALTSFNDLFVSGILEVDGPCYVDNNIVLSTNKYITSDVANYGGLYLRSTSQTVDAMALAIGSVPNYIYICEYGDIAYDFAHTQQVNPTVYLHSANQSTTEWVSIAHNQTWGVLDSGTNGILFEADIITDRWLSQTSNTFLGEGVAGAGTLVHTTGDTGYRNTAFGEHCMYAATSAERNCAFGQYALADLTTGVGNVAIGTVSQRTMQSGVSNVSLGLNSLYWCLSGDGNVALGGNSLQNATGSYNIAVGKSAGDNITSATYCVVIGANVDAASATSSYQLNICNVITCDNWNANGDINLIPNGTGILVVGTDSTSHSLNASGDALISGKFEVHGASYFDSPVYCYSTLQLTNLDQLRLGTSNYTSMEYSTNQTNNAVVMGLSVDSRTFIICEQADRAQNFAGPVEVNPTLRIQSSDATSVDQFIKFQHNQTNGVIAVGAGNLYLNPLDGSDVQCATGLLVSTSGATAQGTIRYDSGDFEGYTAAGWTSLTNNTFIGRPDTPVGYTTANAIYTTNGTPDAVIETTVVLTEAANTFNITKGTASLDIAAGSALDVNANLTVSGVSTIDQNVATTGSPSFVDLTLSGDIELTAGGDITTTSNGDISLKPNGTGDIFGYIASGVTEAFKVTGSTGIHHFPETSGFNAYRDTTQTITTATHTDVVYSTENWDIRSEYATGTGIFTATEAGYYACSWGVQSESVAWAAVNVWTSYLSINNATSGNICRGYRWECMYGYTGFAHSLGSATVKLAASDTLRIKIYHNRGSDTNINANQQHNFFSVIKVA